MGVTISLAHWELSPWEYFIILVSLGEFKGITFADIECTYWHESRPKRDKDVFTICRIQLIRRCYVYFEKKNKLVVVFLSWNYSTRGIWILCFPLYVSQTSDPVTRTTRFGHWNWSKSWQNNYQYPLFYLSALIKTCILNVNSKAVKVFVCRETCGIRRRKKFPKQECIPVGCVPPAHWPDGEPPRNGDPPGWRTPGMEEPPQMENPPNGEPRPRDGEPPWWRTTTPEGEPPPPVDRQTPVKT